MKACGCNIFAGGFTIGVKRHFNVVAQLEHDSYGLEVVKRNLPDVTVFSSKEAWPLDKLRREKLDFVFANPPCAPFSVAAGARVQHTSWDKDPRLQRTYDIVGLLEKLNPTVLATESVVAGWTKGEPMWREKAKEAAKLGYSFTVLLHDAQYLNTPQRRARVFFVFHKVQLEVETPDWSKVITVREAWKGLRVTAAERKRFGNVHKQHKHSQFVAAAKPGERLAHVYNRINKNRKEKLNHLGQKKGRPGFLVSRVPLDKPSTVVLGGDVMFHPTETRLLLPSEVQRLATWPDDIVWPENAPLASITGWMSRGVAPNVGEWLARSVKASLENDKRIRKPFMALHDVRRSPGHYEVLAGEIPASMRKAG